MNPLPINNIVVKKTISTNELAKDLLKKKETGLPFIVQAEFQSKGKGQFNKSWESNASENLLFSLVVRCPDITIEKQFDISKAVAISIRQVIGAFTNQVSIKWPNDIYVGDKKIAGVLIENIIVGQNIDSCIIGIGLNVNQVVFSKSLPNPSSLKLINNSDYNTEDIKNKIVEQILIQLSNFSSTDQEYQKYLYKKGELGQFIDLKGHQFLGVITGIDSIGKLQIRTENNKIRNFSNNEIAFVLPETN